MTDNSPQNENNSWERLTEDDTWLVEEHLSELFAELFNSHNRLEQQLKVLETKINALRLKLDSFTRR